MSSSQVNQIDRERLSANLQELMLIAGPSGYEGRVRQWLNRAIGTLSVTTITDNIGNLILSVPGDSSLPSVMVHTHMDQLGFVVRKIEEDGFIRVERLGGIPERALAAQEILFCIAEGRDITGVIANKSHHATLPSEKYQTVGIADVYVDCGFSSRQAVIDAGIDIGTPAVYFPSYSTLGEGRICGTSIDDRAGCAVLLEVIHALHAEQGLPTVHYVFAVQEEFNLRGVMIAATTLNPAVAIQIDLVQACDTPDMINRGDAVLGGGPGMSLYSFHGRGTLNGNLPHPALVKLFESAASTAGSQLQRSAQTGVLTDNAYVQLTGAGVACIDVGFPMRYSHSAREVCDTADLYDLAQLLAMAVQQIDSEFSLNRDDYIL